jgi:N-acetylglucosaminyldiphosphoundecaprenol N-acetyl-beta-D-mannosaminyltransferase
MIEKINILGVHFSNLDGPELIGLLDGRITEVKKTQVCFVPTNSILAARKSKFVMDVYNSADVVMCDGVPVQWASRMLGTPLKQRLTGFDFFPHFIQHCAEKKYSVYFLGAKEGVAKQLATQYQSRYPGIRVAGYYTPPFAAAFSDDQNKAMLSAINAAKPDVLFVSLTAPKQDIWIHQQLEHLNVKLAIGVGAAFDSEAGSLKRAPIFMQQMGLEWFYRFLQEPGRMFRRYFIEAPVFVPLVMFQFLSTLRRKPNVEPHSN